MDGKPIRNWLRLYFTWQGEFLAFFNRCNRLIPRVNWGKLNLGIFGHSQRTSTVRTSWASFVCSGHVATLIPITMI